MPKTEKMFAMVEQLIETVNALSKTVGSQHDLIKGSANKVREMKAKIDLFEDQVSEYDAEKFILREKMKDQTDELIDLKDRFEDYKAENPVQKRRAN